MDVGCIILCPDRDSSGVKNTIWSVNQNCWKRDAIAIFPKNVSPKTLSETKKFCAPYKGQSTVTSLINTGMKRLQHEWGFFVFAGSRIHPYVENKFLSFVNSEKDVLHPVVGNKYNFIEGSFNGVLINKKFFGLVGNFSEDTPLKQEGINDFEVAKMMWMAQAIKHGAKFKAILGMKVT